MVIRKHDVWTINMRVLSDLYIFQICHLRKHGHKIIVVLACRRMEYCQQTSCVWHRFDDVITCERLSHDWPLQLAGEPSQIASNSELWYYFLLDWTNRFWFAVIWDALALMWRHCNGVHHISITMHAVRILFLCLIWFCTGHFYSYIFQGDVTALQ